VPAFEWLLWYYTSARLYYIHDFNLFFISCVPLKNKNCYHNRFLDWIGADLLLNVLLLFLWNRWVVIGIVTFSKSVGIVKSKSSPDGVIRTLKMYFSIYFEMRFNLFSLSIRINFSSNCIETNLQTLF